MLYLDTCLVCISLPCYFSSNGLVYVQSQVRREFLGVSDFQHKKHFVALLDVSMSLAVNKNKCPRIGPEVTVGCLGVFIIHSLQLDPSRTISDQKAENG